MPFWQGNLTGYSMGDAVSPSRHSAEVGLLQFEREDLDVDVLADRQQ